MLNLLLISDDPKVRTLKNILQPQLKAKVDVVADFDRGLQDVFEKRPATVVIQSVISGVAGESVARHIQMLLGNDAPRFILLCEGDSNTHAVKGLFEHCINLALPVEQLAEEILKALQAVFGDQWINMIVPSKVDAALAASVTASREERELVDRMMDDLIPDMEKPEEVVSEETASLVFDGGDRQWICDTADEMTTLFEATLAKDQPVSGAILPASTAEQTNTKKTARKPRVATVAPKATSGKLEPEQVSVFPEPQSLSDSAVTVDSAPEIAQNEGSIVSSTSPTTPVPSAPQTAPSVAPGQPLSLIVSVSPADFHISGKEVPEKEPIPEELLLAFEANYRSHSRSWKKMALAAGFVGVLGVVGWFILSSKPVRVQSLQKKIPASAAVSATDATPDNVKTATAPVVVPQADKVIPKPAAEPKPATVSNSALPSFVPLKGRDNSYAISKPGWERYVNSAREVRVFRANDRIKAVQIMAGRGKTLDSAFLETVLQELVGSSTHTLGPRELKQGYQGYMVQQGSVGKKAELIVYRKKQTDAIVAFVVSVN